MVKNFVERLMNGLLFEEPGDGGGGSGTQDGNAGADNNGATKPAVDGQAKPGEGTKPGTVPDKFTDDPRYKGMLADLKKERTARQQYDADLKAAKADLERERKRVQLLAGVDPKSPEDADEDLVRERLRKLLPGASDLTPEDLKAFRELKDQLAEMRQATAQQWTSHGRKMLDSVTTEFQKAIGGKLSERQTARIKAAYVEEAKSDPAFLERHEAGDPTLVAEFVKSYLDDFVEPGKRQALASEAARRPRVPGGKDRSFVGANEKPIDVKDDKAVEDLLVKAFRDKGGQFGRR